MQNFITAALPWVLCGIAMAILCARLGGRNGNKDKKMEQRMATGAGLGLMFGVALNSCGLWASDAFGIALGPLWGMALAVLYKEGGKSKTEERDKTGEGT